MKNIGIITRRIAALTMAALTLAASFTLFTACRDGSDGMRKDKTSVVCTIFPEYDWMREIIGDTEGVELTLLISNGVDLHSYQPTVNDSLKIADADMFVYVGGESDKWANDALKATTNGSREVISLLELLLERVLEEEHTEGMDDTHEHGEEEEEKEYDEHVWLSLKNASYCVSKLAERLGAIDADNAGAYSENAAAYIKRLDALESRYKSAVDKATVKTLIFTDRFPFRYMTEDYGLEYFAAFAGCSAETEASFATVSTLAAKLKELSLSHVIVIEGSDKRLAETVIATSGIEDCEILTMNSLQSVTENQMQGSSGATYYSLMEGNLEVLERALS